MTNPNLVGIPTHDVEIVINEDGTVEYEILGIPGGGCTNVQKVLDKALALSVESSRSTREAFQSEGIREHCSKSRDL